MKKKKVTWKEFLKSFTLKTYLICLLVFIFSYLGNLILEIGIPDKKSYFIARIGAIYFSIVVLFGYYYFRKSFEGK